MYNEIKNSLLTYSGVKSGRVSPVNTKNDNKNA